MTNEHERVKIVRKHFDLTMEQFGERLGVKKTSISDIENGRRGLTEQMFKAICREFGINPEWLRTGEGDMIIPMTRSESIAAFVGELMKEEEDSFKRQLVEILANLNEDEWEVLANLAKKLASEDQTENA